MRQKIPTLLALILLLAVVLVGFFIYFVRENNKKSLVLNINPHDIVIANITESSAAIIWHTTMPSISTIRLNENLYYDERDQADKTFKRVTHYVTIPNLTPETEYGFQIEIEGIQYPNTPLTFKTASQALIDKAQQEQQIYTPIRGTLIDSQQQPVDEAIVIIKLPNALPKATFVTASGNYLLPLTKLLSADLTNTVTIVDKQPATLEARKNETASLIQITLPLKDQILSPVTLGKNENLIDFLARPAGTPKPLEFQPQQATGFDLNNDGKVNTLDSSLVSDLIERKQYNPIADFNNDRTIDNQDLDLIKSELK